MFGYIATVVMRTAKFDAEQVLSGVAEIGRRRDDRNATLYEGSLRV